MKALKRRERERGRERERKRGEGKEKGKGKGRVKTFVLNESIEKKKGRRQEEGRKENKGDITEERGKNFRDGIDEGNGSFATTNIIRKEREFIPLPR